MIAMLPVQYLTGPRKPFERLTRAEASELEAGAAVFYSLTHYTLTPHPDTGELCLAGSEVAHPGVIECVRLAPGGRVQVLLKNGPRLHSRQIEEGKLLRPAYPAS